MDALNHADQMRLANLINDNSDDAEIQRKLDQVVELTSSTRDQAAVALHDCHYDVEKAVDMILEGDQAIVENQWKSAGKKKNKNTSSQASKSGAQPGGGHVGASNKNSGPTSGKGNHNPHSGHHSTAQDARPATASSGDGAHNRDHHQQHRGNHHQSGAATQANSSNTNVSAKDQSSKHDVSNSLKNIADISSSNLISTSDSTTASTTAPSTMTAAMTTKTSSMQQHQSQQQNQHPQQHQQSRQKGTTQIGSRQHHQRSTRIPDSAVEMPNNETQLSSLNVQFGELDLKEGAVGSSDSKGTFQDVLESNRLGRQTNLSNFHSSQQETKSNRQSSQQPFSGRGGPRRSYNNSGEDRKFYGNSNRGGRQISGGQRPYNPRSGPLSNQNSSRGGGVRTILNRGLQAGSNLSNSGSNNQSSGFPNSIDTWTNSTAEAVSKQSQDQGVGNVSTTLHVGQWSEVAGNEDWSEEEHWDAKVMETKVFTPSSKAVESPAASQKSQLLTDATVPSQINLSTKLSESARDDVSSQANTLNSVSQPVQSQQSSKKQLSHMNDIFDPSVAKAVLEQQNLAAIKPKTSIGIGQYTKESSEAKNVLDSQNLGSIKPKTTMSINQYNKEASESLKSLVGISTSGVNSNSNTNSNQKGNVPSVPPGALPLISQPQYIMGNAYQPAIFPYAYQAPDVHYPVAPPTTGRDQNFQSVYNPNDGNKFNRGTDGDAPSITTTQTAPVASQTHNQAFVANALHAGYQLTYAMPGAFNMLPQNLYSAAPIFPHIPQPTNTGSANTVYQKSTPGSYQHHGGYSGYDQLNPLIQDYVKQQQQQNYSGSNMQQQPTSKSSGINSELDVTSGGNSYNMYGSVSKGQAQPSKQAGYNDTKGYHQQISANGPQQQFGFSHGGQQPSSLAGGYPLLQPHNLDGSDLSGQTGGAQSQLHSTGQRGGSQVNPSKYYNWN